MSGKNTIKDVIETIDWAKRVEISYRAIVRIIEQTRKYSITSTDYITLLNARYSMAKKMLDFNFKNGKNSEYKVELDDTFDDYLSTEIRWKQTQSEINKVLNELTHFMAEFNDIQPSKEIEASYIDELVRPVNTLLAKYQKENSRPNDVIYELTYNGFTYELMINDIKIYQAKDAGTQLVLSTVFSETGILKQASNFLGSDGNPKKVNTVSVKNNIQTKSNMPKSLNYIFKSFDKKQGIKIITQITQKDLSDRGIKAVEIDDWLNSKI